MINILVGILTLVSAVAFIVRYGIHSVQGIFCMIMLVLSGAFGLFGIAASSVTTAIIRVAAPIALIGLSKMQLKDDYNCYVEATLKRKRRKASVLPIQRKSANTSYNTSLAS